MGSGWEIYEKDKLRAKILMLQTSLVDQSNGNNGETNGYKKVIVRKAK